MSALITEANGRNRPVAEVQHSFSLRPMVYVALAFLIAYSMLFLWLTAKAIRAHTIYGLGWSVAKSDRPATYWLGLAVYLLNLVLALMFLAVVIAFADFRYPPLADVREVRSSASRRMSAMRAAAN